MIAELEDLLPGFSAVNHTRCFLHVVNLIACSLVWQFDVPKSKKNNGPGSNEITEPDPDSDLHKLAENIEAVTD